MAVLVSRFMHILKNEQALDLRAIVAIVRRIVWKVIETVHSYWLILRSEKKLLLSLKIPDSVLISVRTVSLFLAGV